MIRTVPETASVATPTEGGRLCAPSAERNCQPLCNLLTKVAPEQGAALEIASGTGQHIFAFAACLPGLTWQPTEPDPTRRASIDTYVAEAGLSNLSPARDLDAAVPGWGAAHRGQSLIVLVNLLHLISTAEVQTLIDEAAQALGPGGRFVIYGPFMRAGELTSEGDERFHASLRAMDPEIGYKDDFDVLDIALAAGLTPVDVVEMPANNLALVLEKPPG
ncbi:DUF938 domain-containing protein [Sedimentitalea todarodis]|uniref:DUF938 domain-containing protein n=1 Tax=Sedimentitalea todarodis TaxID=1631240 RepID=A0ABU3V9J4_9RHOB|nr:DUF938 domain-containing protein [Sedimentitalea todarodis]MDU9002835.1 DUF938 domain-containing protein [Sedimentitalea todarodis]